MINRTTIGNRNGKKNNYMVISSDKYMKFHMRRPGHGHEREILTEKLNLFYQQHKITQ